MRTGLKHGEFHTLHILDDTPSTSHTTGSALFEGGVGIKEEINTDENISCGDNNAFLSNAYYDAGWKVRRDGMYGQVIKMEGNGTNGIRFYTSDASTAGSNISERAYIDRLGKLYLNYQLRTNGGLYSSHSVNTFTNLPLDTGANVILNASNNLCEETSSIRYKRNVQPFDINPFATLGLSPRIFKYPKKETFNLGYIVEDLPDSPYIINYNAKKQPQSWNYSVFSLYMNECLKKHNKILNIIIKKLNLENEYHQILNEPSPPVPNYKEQDIPMDIEEDPIPPPLQKRNFEDLLRNLSTEELKSFQKFFESKKIRKIFLHFVYGIMIS